VAETYGRNLFLLHRFKPPLAETCQSWYISVICRASCKYYHARQLDTSPGMDCIRCNIFCPWHWMCVNHHLIAKVTVNYILCTSRWIIYDKIACYVQTLGIRLAAILQWLTKNTVVQRSYDQHFSPNCTYYGYIQMEDNPTWLNMWLASQFCL